MSEYNFTKIKKNDPRTHKLSKCLRITKTGIAIAGDVFDNAEHAYVKFDVDTSKRAIRVREGTRGGSRSYSLRKNDKHKSHALGTQTPAPLRELIDSGELARGNYKQVGDSNVFVLA